MNPKTLSPEDPKLTAYALGELDADECAAVAAAIRNDPAAQAAVEQIRALSSQLEEALANEPIEPATLSVDAAASLSQPPAKVVAFPYYWVSGLAAACFAALLILRPTPAETARDAVAQAPVPVKTTAPAVVAPQPRLAEPALAADIAKARRLPSDSLPEINPAPAQADGLQLGRSVASHTSGAPVATDSDPAGMVREPLLGSPEPRSRVADSREGEKSFDGLTSAILTDSRADSMARRNAAYSPSLDFAQNRPVEAPMVYNGAIAPSPTSRGFLRVAGYPLSDVGLTVGTASYGNVRRFLQSGRLPPPDAVRIEEMLNHFAYRLPATRVDGPVAASVEVAAAPWNPSHRLVRIGVRGQEIDRAMTAAANLVFVVDVSGSMGSPSRLPLVKESLRATVETLRRGDRIAIVSYAGTNAVVLPPTDVARSDEILRAIDALEAGGAVDGAPGIKKAFAVAQAGFVQGGNNRVILCTDGDFALGGNERDTFHLIEEKARAGVSLAVLGFGLDSSHSGLLEKMANRGQGICNYVDTRAEAERLLVAQTSRALVAVANNVKLQVEFNPEVAKSYRLIGYEDGVARKVAAKDGPAAGDALTAGHVITALYEVVPVGAPDTAVDTDPLRYASDDLRGERLGDPRNRELLTLKVRYELPTVDVGRKVEIPLVDPGTDFSAASKDFKFAAAVAGFGMLLKESPHKGTATYDKVLAWAQESEDEEDTSGSRTEFIDLVKKAKNAAVE